MSKDIIKEKYIIIKEKRILNLKIVMKKIRKKIV